ncbi:MAG: hypothetical protein RMJ84_08290, partial [Sandaracinaceae bacterium]|nr:hypothetical protein [Sandaracinaceae bacterium]
MPVRAQPQEQQSDKVSLVEPQATTKGESEEFDEDELPPEGPPCGSNEDCSVGKQCRGPSGCKVQWACGEAKVCGEDRVAYCDCDGVTFFAPRGCPGRPYRHIGACELGALAQAGELGSPPGDEPWTNRDRICQSDADCTRGRRCYGPPGCGVPWRCERVRGCGSAQEEFCGCDGQSFRANRLCPGRPYAHRGPCGEGEAIAGAMPQLQSPQLTRGMGSDSPFSYPPHHESIPHASSSPDGVSPEGRPCQTHRDCPKGELCIGPQGCEVTWTCQKATYRCNPDTQVFCDCQGRTFRASMNCPSRPYAHRGSCEL